MSEELFNAASPLAALRELCEQASLPVVDEGENLLMQFESADAVGGAIAVRLGAVESPKLIRATALAQGASLSRDYLSDALMFCNIWNANRPYPRAVVVNVEERDRDLAFMLDMNLKVDLPLPPEYVRDRFLTAFLAGADEFFNAVGKTFATVYQN